MEPIQGEPLRADEQIVCAAWDDGYRQTIPRMNDVLGRLLTLSTALAGGSMVLLGKDVCEPWLRAAATLLFAAALVTSTIGVIPVSVNYGTDCIDTMRDEIRRATINKTWRVWLSVILIVAGILAATIGTLVKGA